MSDMPIERQEGRRDKRRKSKKKRREGGDVLKNFQIKPRIPSTPLSI
jgi:hypothetical protein